jgi:diguanylate cyclase (GGDEF)-like protein
VTLALLDLDYFKLVNDTCSHEVGDEVLRTVAELLQGNLEDGSFAARMGGEEFLLVLVGAGPRTAARHLEDVRQTVAAHPWTELTGAMSITVSIGAASTTGHAEPTAVDLLGRADAHLYRAKRGGRDRVVSDLPSSEPVR